jgi:NAD(P)-dependent dehydrogenase (short-subunit alcohol dehydrogenase family)
MDLGLDGRSAVVTGGSKGLGLAIAAELVSFDTLTDADWQGDFEVKLMSHVRCTRAALPYLRQSAA